MHNSAIQSVKDYFLKLQNILCKDLASEDGKGSFQEDSWERSNGGSGRSHILIDGNIFEQAGVNFSHIYGEQMPTAATAKRPELTGSHFQAMGVSVVIHPSNPYVPTAHLNVRFFSAKKDQGSSIWWFGGGLDLTPYYGFVEDCKHWHQTAKNICQPFGTYFYEKLKQQCDDYFYLKHRQEARGIGGLFFDDLNEWGFAASFDFIRSLGDQFLTAYLPIVQRRKNMPYGEQERDFQCYRRGRYVEFNLIYDRGTLFGLQFGGRAESILMSLPPKAAWRYNWQPAANTPEAKLYNYFLVPRNWLNES